MMKKLIMSAALVFSLLFLFSCGETGKSENIVGLWKYSLNEQYRDIITGVIDDERAFVDIYYQFNEDGTGRTYASDGSYDRDFTYVYSKGVITITSAGYSFDQSCVLTDTTLTIHDTEEDEDVVFVRQENAE